MDLNHCLAPHPTPPREDCLRVTWLEPRGDDRCRVIAWTCDCRRLYFELCASGGLTFVRRTVRETEWIVTAETHRGPLLETEKIWTALLHGLAR
ncbi:hypothetical protein [Nonomuraea typhae]|uniref:hypothetical protein n=1 Tax=Nonomuraea typhae TaxID=2603600 RepID=UPI0012FBC266|nr:hypothetical protein [Nonomuraea typhae]